MTKEKVKEVNITESILKNIAIDFDGKFGFNLYNNPELIKNSISFSCRDNGDVGSETSGKVDFLNAKELATKIITKYPKSQYPNLRIKIECVDEYVHIDITILLPQQIEREEWDKQIQQIYKDLKDWNTKQLKDFSTRCHVFLKKGYDFNTSCILKDVVYELLKRGYITNYNGSNISFFSKKETKKIVTETAIKIIKLEGECRNEFCDICPIRTRNECFIPVGNRSEVLKKEYKKSMLIKYLIEVYGEQRASNLIIK